MINNICRRYFSTAGSLLTWGETTYGWGRPISNALRTPGIVEGFKDVSHVATGPYHLTFISQSTGVHSVGLGKNGRLGHNSETSYQSPERIDFFHSNRIDVKQLACGMRHSLALSKDGQVFSWGYGGGSQATYMFNKFFRGNSPLGHGVNVDSYEPKSVSALEDVKVKQISAGYDFSLALAENGKIYGWGDGIGFLGVSSGGLPAQIQDISYFADKKHSQIRKISSAHTFAFFLFDNGSLYTVGKNNGGVQGTRANPLIKTDKWLPDITKVNDQFFQGEKVEDFAISANSLIIMTESGNLYYCGMHLKYRPEPFPAAGDVKKIFATYDSVGYIDQDNKIRFINDQIVDEADKSNDVFTCEQETLNGNVIEIGGNYTLRYALVQK